MRARECVADSETRDSHLIQTNMGGHGKPYNFPMTIDHLTGFAQDT